MILLGKGIFVVIIKMRLYWIRVALIQRLVSVSEGHVKTQTGRGERHVKTKAETEVTCLLAKD